MADLASLAAEWPILSRRLDEALALAPAQRDAWLASLDEPGHIKDQLRQLLAHAGDGLFGAETDDFAPRLPQLTLGADMPRPGATDVAIGSTARAGMEVGPYRLLRELGVGGMGLVWLAERRDGGLKRPVALKLPHVSWSRGLAERLARERDILARLDHPNIAQIFDAGLDEAGRPYLALEYVEGEPIDEHCRRLSLPLRQRLHLLLQVARAVAHAHARLVVHRDLKPANILVTSAGDVRLLDFGIAKLLEGDATQETELTALGGRALTLDYASPEQVRGEPLGAASDVYSLGVVAYEVLTGSRPYQLKRAGAAALEEAIAAVEVRPASHAAADAAVARALRGDLDAILNRALKKEVAQRYPTVDALAQDIERHLKGLPVQARPDALGYRAGKFLRRHAIPVAAAGATAMALVIGLSVATWQAHEARAQARRAEAVREFIKRVFSASDPDQAPGRELSARELLARGADRLEADLKGQPEVQAELQHEIGEILLAQGANVDAKLHFEKAIALYESLGMGDGDTAMGARLRLADLLNNESQFEASTGLARRALAVAERRGGPPPRWALNAADTLSFALAQQGRPQEAASLLERALADHRRAGYGPDVYTEAAQVALGHAHMAMEQYAQARDAFSKAVDDGNAVREVRATQRLSSRMYLQYARYFLNDIEATARDLPAVVEGLEKLLGLKHGTTLSARLLMAQVLVRTGHHEQGLQLQRDNVALTEARTTIDRSRLAFYRGVLARLLQLSERPAESIEMARQALVFMDEKNPAPHWTAESVRIVLGESQRAAGQPEAAMQTLMQTEERVRTLPGHEKSIRYARLLRSLALCEYDLGRAGDARATLARSLAIYEAHWPTDPLAQNARTMMAWMSARADAADVAAQARFTAAAQAYADLQSPQHLTHLQLALLRADLLRQRADSADARAQWSAATRAWERFTGRPWQPPVSSLD